MSRDKGDSSQADEWEHGDMNMSEGGGGGCGDVFRSDIKVQLR